jgi:phosphotransferase system enzyme I (PtsI)
MHPAQILAVKQEVLRADTGRLAPWARQVVESEDPASLITR